jgi:hypothetical protein
MNYDIYTNKAKSIDELAGQCRKAIRQDQPDEVDIALIQVTGHLWRAASRLAKIESGKVPLETLASLRSDLKEIQDQIERIAD